MEDILSKPIFTVGGEAYTLEDALLAARLWGEWAAFEEEVRLGAACLKKAAVSGDPVSGPETDSAVKEFRYAHDLLTAQETADWLKRWGIGFQEWVDYFHRALLRQRWADDLAGVASEFPVTAAEVDGLVLVEGVCSGNLRGWALKLAGRAAVADRVLRQSTEAPDALDDEANRLLQSLPAEARGAPNHRLENLARLEAAFNRFRKEVITEKAVKDRIASHYLEWIRIECSRVTFDSEQAANEAALCVREDGLTLDEVASDARRSPARAVLYLDQVDGELKEHLLGAQQCSLIGPLKAGGEHALFWLIQKQMPSQEDPLIRERAEAAILKSAVSHEINNRVQWLADL